MKKAITNHLETSLPQSGQPIKQAILDVLLGGKSWRSAATDNGVTEGGIARAMLRSKVREFISSRKPD